MLKKVLITTGVVIALTFAAGFAGFQWLIASISTDTRPDPDITPQLLSYVTANQHLERGRILAIVTSVSEMGTSGKATGYELSELARAYYVFQANGFDVDIASPLGGEPPVVIDSEDMGNFDYAFLNDPEAMNKVRHSLPVAEVNPADYEALYFVGGKGAMYDFPDNASIQTLISTMYTEGKVISAVCHGPAALVNVTLPDGSALVADKRVSAFTNSEELTLIPDAEEIFPFLLQSRLEQQSAQVITGPDYLDQVSVQDNLVTGQNPWSVWTLAEQVITQLGYTPVPREITAEENAAEILKILYTQDLSSAKALAADFQAAQRDIKKELIAVHGILSIMQLKPGNFIDIVRLLHAMND